MKFILLINGILFAFLVFTGNLNNKNEDIKQKKKALTYGVYFFTSISFILSILFYLKKVEWINSIGLICAIISTIAIVMIIGKIFFAKT